MHINFYKALFTLTIAFSTSLALDDHTSPPIATKPTSAWGTPPGGKQSNAWGIAPKKETTFLEDVKFSALPSKAEFPPLGSNQTSLDDTSELLAQARAEKRRKKQEKSKKRSEKKELLFRQMQFGKIPVDLDALEGDPFSLLPDELMLPILRYAFHYSNHLSHLGMFDTRKPFKNLINIMSTCRRFYHLGTQLLTETNPNLTPIIFHVPESVFKPPRLLQAPLYKMVRSREDGTLQRISLVKEIYEKRPPDAIKGYASFCKRINLLAKKNIARSAIFIPLNSRTIHAFMRDYLTHMGPGINTALSIQRTGGEQQFAIPGEIVEKLITSLQTRGTKVTSLCFIDYYDICEDGAWERYFASLSDLRELTLSGVGHNLPLNFYEIISKFENLKTLEKIHISKTSFSIEEFKLLVDSPVDFKIKTLSITQAIDTWTNENIGEFIDIICTSQKFENLAVLTLPSSQKPSSKEKIVELITRKPSLKALAILSLTDLTQNDVDKYKKTHPHLTIVGFFK